MQDPPNASMKTARNRAMGIRALLDFLVEGRRMVKARRKSKHFRADAVLLSTGLNRACKGHRYFVCCWNINAG
jgi:hypothetical protein